MQLIIPDHVFTSRNMLIDSDQRKLLYKLAVSYYEDGLTQKQIGKRFGLSRIKVSRLLRQARELKVVQVHITPMDGSNAELERALGEKYGIDEVITVAAASTHPVDITRSLGPVAAESLLRCIQGKEVVTVTWGCTLTAVGDHLPAANRPGLRIVQALGGLSSPDADINGTELVQRMAQTLGGKPLVLSSPGLVANQQVRDALLMDGQVSKTLALAARADIALVGIGIFSPRSALLHNNILSEADVERLRGKGAVGDIGLRFFNSRGEKIADEIDDRLIGLDLEQYKKIKRVIGVAGGEEKIAAIHAALIGRLIDVLVTDDSTARFLLER